MVIVDKTVLVLFRKPRCEICFARGATAPHHIQCRGMGGGKRIDHPINLIGLCHSCHDKAHRSELSQERLWVTVARRERVSREVIPEVLLAMKQLPQEASAGDLCRVVADLSPAAAALLKTILAELEGNT